MEYSKVYSSSPTDGDGKNYLLFENDDISCRKKGFSKEILSIRQSLSLKVTILFEIYFT